MIILIGFKGDAAAQSV